MSEPGNWIFTVLERRGERFKSRYEGDKRIHEVNGTIKDGRLRWLARDVKVIAGQPGHDNEGEIKGGEVAMSYSDPASGLTVGRFTLRLQKRALGSPDQLASAFRPLFDGRTLAGWQTHPNWPGNWRVENGVLIGSGSETSHLYSKRGDYTSFHLRVDARINDGGNSGVFVRASSGPVWPTDRPQWPLGYEAQINATHKDPNKTGGLYIADRGAMISLSETPIGPNEWFTMDVIAEGKSLVIKVNGQVTAEFVDDTREFSSGHIALQQATPETLVEFRKIEIKELTASTAAATPEIPALLHGKDLARKDDAPRVLYADSFDDPNSGWPRDETPNKNDRHGYEAGIFFPIGL